MKNKFKKIIKDAQKLSLSTSEKDSMRASIFQHIAENPPIAEVLWKGEKPSILSYFNMQNMRTLVPALVLVLLVGAGGAAFASKYSLPGDILYPVKILNEKVESDLAITGAAKEKVDTEHAVARLEEAETLSVQGKLDEEKKTTLANSFQKNRNNSKESKDDFVKNLPQSLQSIAVVIDPSIAIATSSTPDKKGEDDHIDNQAARHKEKDYRIAKQKDKISTTAATATGVSASSTASTTASSQSSSAVTIPAVKIPPITLPKL